jgi:hypothetical protein
MLFSEEKHGFPNIGREPALNKIIRSIAFEETALGKIIEAESDKIHYVIELVKEETGEGALNKILKTNESVEKILKQIEKIEIILKRKMDEALKCRPPIPPPPCPPFPPPLPPCPPPPCPPPPAEDIRRRSCVSCFAATPNSCWKKGDFLTLRNKSLCGDCVKIRNCSQNKYISLPPNGIYSIELDFDLKPECSKNKRLEIKAVLDDGHGNIGETRFVERFSGGTLNFKRKITVKIPRLYRKYNFGLSLDAPGGVRVIDGKITVKTTPNAFGQSIVYRCA